MKQEFKVTRRQLFRVSALAGAGALATACARAAIPTAPPPASTARTSAATEPAITPPAPPKGGTITILHRPEFFPELEQQLRKTVEGYVKSQGYEPDLSIVGNQAVGEFAAKMEAAVQAGNPPDLVYYFLSLPQLHELGLLTDVSDVVEELIGKYGDVVPANAARLARFDGKWMSVPFVATSGAWFVRKDVADAAGVDLTQYDTLQDPLDAAVKMSDPSKQMYGWGLTVNASGDGDSSTLTAIHAFGGRLVDETGQKVTFNSPETVAGVQWLADIYAKPKYKAKILPPGVESWTDPSNNEAYLAGVIGMTANAFSIYAAAKKDKNPVFDHTFVARFPKTNDGAVELGNGSALHYTIFKGAKNVDVAKDVIRHVIDPVAFTPLASLGAGLFMPAYKNNWTDDLLKVESVFPTQKEIMFNETDYTTHAYPAKQTNAAIDAAWFSGFPSQMMADAIAGRKTAEQAVKDSHDQIVQIFEEKGLPQN